MVATPLLLIMFIVLVSELAQVGCPLVFAAAIQVVPVIRAAHH
jgi:hypothetical protein